MEDKYLKLIAVIIVTLFAYAVLITTIRAWQYTKAQEMMMGHNCKMYTNFRDIPIINCN